MCKWIRNLNSLMATSLLVAGCSSSTKSTVRTSSSAPRSVRTSETYASAEPISRPLDEQELAVSEPRPLAERVELASVRTAPSATAAHPRIGFEEFSQQVENKSALIIDARAPDKFAQGHVRGAINIPTSQKEAYTEQFLRGVDPNQPIFIYCGSESCPASDNLYEYLLTQGFTNMRVFKPGWAVLGSAKHLH